MRISDKSAFLENKRVLTVETKQGDSKKFVIALNFPLSVYYKVLCLVDVINHTEDIYYKIESAGNAVTAILKTADDTIDLTWVLQNIEFQNQLDILSQIIGATDILLDDECLKIPEIEVKENTPTAKNSEAKERQKKKDDIKRLTKLLSGKRTAQLMDEIAIVMTKTHNSYSEIMKMPMLIFKDIVRTVIINENRTDDDYNLAYLRYECEKYKIELNSGKADEKPAQRKGADLKKLKSLLG